MKIWLRTFHHELRFGNPKVESIFLDILAHIEQWITRKLISYELDWETIVESDEEYEKAYDMYWKALKGIDEVIINIVNDIAKKRNVYVYLYDASHDWYDFIILISLTRITNELFRLDLEVKVNEADDVVFIDVDVRSTTIVFEKLVDFKVLASEMELDYALWSTVVLTITDPSKEEQFNLPIELACVESDFYTPNLKLELPKHALLLT